MKIDSVINLSLGYIDCFLTEEEKQNLNSFGSSYAINNIVLFFGNHFPIPDAAISLENDTIKEGFVIVDRGYIWENKLLLDNPSVKMHYDYI